MYADALDDKQENSTELEKFENLCFQLWLFFEEVKRAWSFIRVFGGGLAKILQLLERVRDYGSPINLPKDLVDIRKIHSYIYFCIYQLVVLGLMCKYISWLSQVFWC